MRIILRSKYINSETMIRHTGENLNGKKNLEKQATQSFRTWVGDSWNNCVIWARKKHEADLLSRERRIDVTREQTTLKLQNTVDCFLLADVAQRGGQSVEEVRVY